MDMIVPAEITIPNIMFAVSTGVIIEQLYGIFEIVFKYGAKFSLIKVRDCKRSLQPSTNNKYYKYDKFE